LASIASRLTEVEVPAGETLISNGDPGDGLFVVWTGRVRVHDGVRTLAEFGEREVVAALSAIAPEPREASVTAVEDSVLYRLDHVDFDDVLAADLDVSRGVIKALVRQLRQATAAATGNG